MKPSKNIIKRPADPEKRKLIHQDLYYDNGDETHFCDSALHKLDGPALIYFGSKHWYIQDELINCSTQEEFENSKEYREWKLKAFK